jgi:hypothetical protein
MQGGAQTAVTQGRSVALKLQAAREAGRATALNDRQRRRHHRRGQLNHVTIQMYRGSAQCDACARAGWWEQHGRAEPPRHLGGNERTGRRRRHQPGQPAAGVAGVSAGGEGVRELAKTSGLSAPAHLCSPWSYDEQEILRYSNRLLRLIGAVAGYL